MGSELRAMFFTAIMIDCLIVYTGEIAMPVTNFELRQLSERLFSYENVKFADHVQANLQGHLERKNYRDIAPHPLLTIDPGSFETPVMACIRKLFDNYIIDTRVEEIVTPVEYDEEESLLDVLLDMAPVHQVMSFLADRGFIEAGNQTYKNTLRDVWFSQYSRRKSRRTRGGSSGFEHIFLGELKSGKKLMGLHNWMYFYNAEKAGTLDYWGYSSQRSLGDNVTIIRVVFQYTGKIRSSSMFVGISPELELSLYTLCYFVRPDKHCRMSRGGTKFGIQTWILNHTTTTKPSLGSAYPVL